MTDETQWYKFGCMKCSRAYVPAQEIILVWVFVINLHLQLLTRHFMDNDLMHQTHKDMKTEGDLRGRWHWPHVPTNEKETFLMLCSLIWSNGNRMEWKWSSSYACNSWNKTASHLVRLVPLGSVGVVDMFGGKLLRADPHDGIRVRQASHHPFHIVVLSCQVLCLQQVNTHHSLLKNTYWDCVVY